MVRKKDGMDTMDGGVSDEKGVGLDLSPARSSWWYTGPRYWQLPPKFKGNKVTLITKLPNLGTVI